MKCTTSSKELRAKSIIKSGGITFDAVMGTFNVKDEVGKVFLVTLEPQSCSCGDLGCCHILAVAISTRKIFLKSLIIIN